MSNEQHEPTRLEKMMERFNRHHLEVLLDTDEVSIYRFAQPGTNNLAQEWIFRTPEFGDPYLVVTGDCYTSVYESRAVRSIKAAASLNLEYFQSKCTADGEGRRQRAFCSDTATESIHRHIIERWREDNVFNHDDSKIIKLAALSEYLDEDIPDRFDDYYDTVVWLRDNPDIVGDDWYTGINMEVLNHHPYFHLAALRKAAELLETAKPFYSPRAERS